MEQALTSTSCSVELSSIAYHSKFTPHTRLYDTPVGVIGGFLTDDPSFSDGELYKINKMYNEFNLKQCK